MMGTTRIFDGNKIYTIVPEDEEVTISTLHPDNDAEITPNKMLTFTKKDTTPNGHSAKCKEERFSTSN